jgi:cell division protein FtsQ
MDGGGRVLEPLTAGFPGRAAGRPEPTVGPARTRSFRPSLHRIPFLRRKRRPSFVAVPLARRLPRLTGTALLLAFFGATAAYGVVVGGQYDAMRQQHGEPRDIAARVAGFGLGKVTISGIVQLSEREVLTMAGIHRHLSLPFLSVAEIRAKLESAPLVKSAVVRKLYPNELAITLVEREPYALWQINGELSVVAADGTVIDRMSDARFASLPLVVGDQANKRAASYVALLEAAGPLRSRIRAGMLVSGRRWTLKMDNGLDVKLPEENAVEAVARLARLEREQRILEKDVLALDLRIADRIVVRFTEEAAAARQELVKKRSPRGTKGAEI